MVGLPFVQPWGFGWGGLKVEVVLLDFLQGEDTEAKVWKLLPWANVPNYTHVFCRGFSVCMSFVIPGKH